MTSTERWLPIVDVDGRYEVSDLGRVRRAGGRVINGSPNPTTGHVRVQFYRPGLPPLTRMVHRLVLLAFVGPPPAGMEACHNDGSSGNNRLSNLRWDTRSANVLDCVRHGNHHLASKVACKRGHSLAGPNLVLRRDGSRKCRSCNRAHAIKSKLARSGVRVDFDAEADRQFLRLMSSEVAA